MMRESKTDFDSSDGQAKDVKSNAFYYLRWALTGGHSGPLIDLTMQLLGRDVVLQRLTTGAVELTTLSVDHKLRFPDHLRS